MQARPGHQLEAGTQAGKQCQALATLTDDSGSAVRLVPGLVAVADSDSDRPAVAPPAQAVPPEEKGEGMTRQLAL